MEEKFSIKNKEFEGPFDILLEMIQKKKVAIDSISLSEITDDYIQYIKNNETKLDDKTYFVYTASILMLIKSKALLPKMNLQEDEEEDIDMLKNRLSFLKKIKEASLNVKEFFGKNILYKKKYLKRTEIKFRPDDSISLKNIVLALDNLIMRSPLVEKLPTVEVAKQKTLKEIISEIEKRVNTFVKFNFNEINFSNKKEKSISFLAVLELFRNGKIELNQNESFGNISIGKKNN